MFIKSGNQVLRTPLTKIIYQIIAARSNDIGTRPSPHHHSVGVKSILPVAPLLYKKQGIVAEVPSVIDSDLSSKAFRQSWARLVQKIVTCPGLERGSRPSHLSKMFWPNEYYLYS